MIRLCLPCLANALLLFQIFWTIFLPPASVMGIGRCPFANGHLPRAGD